MSDKEYPIPEPNACGGYYCGEEHGHIDCAGSQPKAMPQYTCREAGIPYPDYKDLPLHDHACNCGGALGQHETGCPGCLREITADEPEHLTPHSNDLWRLGCDVITATSLFEQRLYFRHPCGCWSRVKGGSTNSIEA